MKKKRILGLDLGSKTLGIAISDTLNIIARPLENYTFPTNEFEFAINKVVQIVNEKNISLIVLGLPKHMNNDIGEQAQASIKFKEMLEEKTLIKVVLVDERMSTIVADKTLIKGNVSRKKRKQIIDKMAAVVILQKYLDSQGE